jgi:uncharacterized membrane protein YgcG
MVPLLRQGDYNGAILQMAGEIAQVIAQDSHVSLDGLAGFQAAPAGRQPTQLTGGQIILLIIVFLIVAPFLFKFLGPWFLLSLLTGGGGARKRWLGRRRFWRGWWRRRRLWGVRWRLFGRRRGWGQGRITFTTETLSHREEQDCSLPSVVQYREFLFF